MYFYGKKKQQKKSTPWLKVEPWDEMLLNLCNAKQRGGKEGIQQGYSNWLWLGYLFCCTK